MNIKYAIQLFGTLLIYFHWEFICLALDLDYNARARRQSAPQRMLSNTIDNI